MYRNVFIIIALLGGLGVFAGDGWAQSEKDPAVSLQELEHRLYYLKINDWSHEDLTGQFDQALEEIRHKHGLLLDLRGSGEGSLETAYRVIGRLSEFRLRGVTLQVKELETSELTEQIYYMEPRGEWQFGSPIVIVIDSTVGWPGQAVVLALQERDEVSVVGDPPAPVQIPGAVIIAPEGEPLEEAGIMVNQKVQSSGEGDAILEAGIRRLELDVEMYRQLQHDRMQWMLDGK